MIKINVSVYAHFICLKKLQHKIFTLCTCDLVTQSNIQVPRFYAERKISRCGISASAAEYCKLCSCCGIL